MDEKNRTSLRSKIVVTFFLFLAIFVLLAGRLTYLMIGRSAYYSEAARELHERERSIKAARGRIVDRTGKVLADNRTVCTISVIHNQIKEPEKVIRILSGELGLEEAAVRKKVEKYSSIERIKSNVDKETGDRIREYALEGVKVDEDYKRYYPYQSLASKVLGFTGGDNQGIIGLEVVYEEYLQGKEGRILTVTDAAGVELAEEGERRIEPVNGNDLHISIDMNIQSYATQLAMQAMETKQADGVSLLVMNPKNGEILALADVPEFDLNDPFRLPEEEDVGEEEGDHTGKDTEEASGEEAEKKKEQDALNRIWRNSCLNDTYEPGSTFKIITAAAGLEAQVVSLEDRFSCPGYVMVEDRRIRCHKAGGHGEEDFVTATMNSCNPAFVNVGMRLGADRYYAYFEKFGLLKKTGIDLPGEAATIMHKKDNIKAVELATISFGQSFQITPIQLAATVSSIINGGNRVTPHFGVKVVNEQGEDIRVLQYPVETNIVSAETSEKMRYILEQVVEKGGGINGAVEGYRVGGKTATSQTLPRGSGKYISSFLGFAPAEDPQVLAIAIIHHPKGVYYGGQIAAPVVRQLFENILPYLNLEQKQEQQQEQK